MSVAGMNALGRARFTENILTTALRLGVRQYVTLGEGLGDFSLRERELTEHLDCYRVEENTPDRRSALLRQGFRPERKTLFTWLGCSQQKSRDGLNEILSEVADLSAEGSSLVMDLPYEDEESLFQLQMEMGDLGFLLMEVLTPEEIRLMLLSDSESIAHTSYLHAVWKGA